MHVTFWPELARVAVHRLPSGRVVEVSVEQGSYPHKVEVSFFGDPQRLAALYRSMVVAIEEQAGVGLAHGALVDEGDVLDPVREQGVAVVVAEAPDFDPSDRFPDEDPDEPELVGQVRVNRRYLYGG